MISLSMGSFNFRITANFIATRGLDYLNTYLLFESNTVDFKSTPTYYDCSDTYLLFESDVVHLKSTPICIQIDTNHNLYTMIV